MKNLKCKIYFDLFNSFFGYYMIPYVLFHSFDVFTIILQCVISFYNVLFNSKNKGKPLNEVSQLLTVTVCNVVMDVCQSYRNLQGTTS